MASDQPIKPPVQRLLFGVHPIGKRGPNLKPAEVEELVAAYLAGEKTSSLAVRFRRSQSGVESCLKAQRVSLRPQRGEVRRYSHDEAAFDVMTPDALYFGGLLFADGCIGMGRKSTSPMVRINLSGEDGAHLETLRTFLKAEHPVRCYPPQTRKDGMFNAPVTTLNVTSPRLVSALVKYGVVPRKSHTADPPDEVAKSADFWRGVVDGDGSLGWARWKNRRYPTIGVVGTLATCEKFRCFCLTASPAFRAKPCRLHGVWQFTVAGKAAIDVTRSLYAHGGPALPRKKALAVQFLSLP